MDSCKINNETPQKHLKDIVKDIHIDLNSMMNVYYLDK
jgi:hypothetical protein